MYIIVEHQITNPKAFWDTVKHASFPSNLKLHQNLPNSEGTKSVCLWEASGVEDVKKFVESAVGTVSNNTYFAVETGSAMGLPGSVKV